jgi:hypothetical protein
MRPVHRELTTGPKIGPIKAALAKTGKAKTRSIGSQRSEIDPPAQVRGVEPKNPSRKRKTSWALILGASPDATDVVSMN